MSQPNQFTKARDAGLPMPFRRAHKLDEATKDKIRAEVLARRVYRYANAKGQALEKYRMEPAQVQAAKVLIDRGKPTLQSVEQHQADPLDGLSELQMIEMAKALILLHPEVIRALNLIPDPAVVQQTGQMPEVTTNVIPIEDTGT